VASQRASRPTSMRSARTSSRPIHLSHIGISCDPPSVPWLSLAYTLFTDQCCASWQG
jgi:hypothetical protein